jgi:UDP:flavonoid glycosyltransferase YjiC (YdhE family)
MTLSHDQFDNALRVKRLGCGDASSRAPSAAGGAAKLKHLLEDASVRKAAAMSLEGSLALMRWHKHARCWSP